MSDHYLDSTWCADERDWWVNTQAELGLAHAERIAVARIWPTSSSWPPALADERGNPLVGVCFYDKERAAERPQPCCNEGAPAAAFRTVFCAGVG